MAAANYEDEVGRGIRNSIDPADNPGARCALGGARATKETDPHRIPIIREWEFAEGRVVAFTRIDSCLGALQVVDDFRLRGAHFSMFASGVQYDIVQFNAAMRAAGFQLNRPILYFGGGVEDWRDGLAASAYMRVGGVPPHVQDAAQRIWIFEMDNGAFTSHSMA